MLKALLLSFILSFSLIADDCLKNSLGKTQSPNSLRNLTSSNGLVGATGNSYKTKIMKLHYWGERLGLKYGTIVKRFNQKKLNDLEIFIKDGFVVDKHGKKLTLYDAIYTMDKRGRIYFFPDEERGVIHHSTLGRGKAVAAAGHLTIENGVLKSVTNFSGHYSPTKVHLDQIENELRQRGTDLNQTKFHDFYELTKGL